MMTMPAINSSRISFVVQPRVGISNRAIPTIIIYNVNVLFSCLVPCQSPALRSQE